MSSHPTRLETPTKLTGTNLTRAEFLALVDPSTTLVHNSSETMTMTLKRNRHHLQRLVQLRDLECSFVHPERRTTIPGGSPIRPSVRASG